MYVCMHVYNNFKPNSINHRYNESQVLDKGPSVNLLNIRNSRGIWQSFWLQQCWFVWHHINYKLEGKKTTYRNLMYNIEIYQQH